MRAIIDPVNRVQSLVLTLVFALQANTSIARPHFTDVTEAAGLSYLQHRPGTVHDCLFLHAVVCELKPMTGGAAVADVDLDGDLDLYVTRLDGPDLLFCNQLQETGDAIFEDCTIASGLQGYNLQSNGAAFGDIDNDGDPDLYVTVVGNTPDHVNNRNYLFINNGDGSFYEQAVIRGAAMQSSLEHRGYSATFGDYDRDGWLDLHSVEWNPSAISNSRLLHNLGSAEAGYFEDRTADAGVQLDKVFAFASTFTDLDDDGWADLVVTGDFGTSRLFWNNGDGTFTDGTALAGVGTDENGMGSTIGDIDGDGDLDWFVTSVYDTNPTCGSGVCNWGGSGNRLYRYVGNRSFGNATDATGVRNGHWGWGTALFDYDNDGDLDLVMTNGVDFPEGDRDGRFLNDPMRFWENDGTGKMTEISLEVGVSDTRSGKGLLVFDYDNDGDQDLFVVNNGSTPVLYRNEGGDANDWLRVKTIGTESARDAIGTRVHVQLIPGSPVHIREIGSVSHFLGQSETVAHFGLGSGTEPVASVTLFWPSGQVQKFSGVERNKTLIAVEPPLLDTDNDTIPDNMDNCVTTANVSQLDSDGDHLGDVCDNCILNPNGPLIPDAGSNIQLDTDGDGYGNICDPDFNNDKVVDTADLLVMKQRFFMADPDTDLDGNGVVNAADLAILKTMLFQPPGPSARDTK